MALVQFAISLAGFQLSDKDWEYFEGAEFSSYPFRGMFDPCGPEGNACEFLGENEDIMVVTVELAVKPTVEEYTALSRTFVADVEQMVSRSKAYSDEIAGE